MSDSPRLAELRQQEEELVFSSFDNHDAWRLGSLIANHAIASEFGVAIDIRRHNIVKSEGQAVLGRQTVMASPWDLLLPG